MSDVSLVRIAGWGTVTVNQIRKALTAVERLKKRNRKLTLRVRELEKLIADHKEGD